MPLVQGHSHIRWHLPHSIHGEHRGRTPKCPIVNHRVEYNYGKLVPVRIAIDKTNSLGDCPIEFEVVQEFSSAASGTAGGGGRDERITLGRLTLNLAEYVEESEAFIRDTGYRVKGPSFSSGSNGNVGNGAGGANSGSQEAHARKRSSLSIHTPANSADPASSPKSTPTSTSKSDARKSTDAPAAPPVPEAQVDEGIVRRYLMSDSKINSTLKIGVLMVQLDGERNFVAPALKTAAVFGGIAGMTSSSSTHPAAEDFGQHFQDGPGPAADSGPLNSTGAGGAATSSSANSRDVYELQDMYRRALAASWACQPGELPADECIEDIFQGGDGFNPDGSGELMMSGGESHTAGDVTPRGHGHGHGSLGGRGGAMRSVMRREDSGSSTGEGNDFLRLPGSGGQQSPKRSGAAQRRHHARHGSGESVNTMRHEGGLGMQSGLPHQPPHGGRPAHRRESSKDSASSRGGMLGMRSRSGSLASLAGTIETERGRSGFKSAREVTEWEVRDDMVAWKLPGTAS